MHSKLTLFHCYMVIEKNHVRNSDRKKESSYEAQRHISAFTVILVMQIIKYLFSFSLREISLIARYFYIIDLHTLQYIISPINNRETIYTEKLPSAILYGCRSSVLAVDNVLLFIIQWPKQCFADDTLLCFSWYFT